MTNHDIATFLLDRVTRVGSPFAFSGEMQSSLGDEGFGEALRLGWLRGDPDSGALQIANDASSLHSMRLTASAEDVAVAANESDGYQVGDQVIVTSGGKPVTARVKTVRPDGTYELDFGAAGTTTQSPFKREQMRPVSRPDTRQPQSSTVTSQPPKEDPLKPNNRGGVEQSPLARYPIGR